MSSHEYNDTERLLYGIDDPVQSVEPVQCVKPVQSEHSLEIKVSRVNSLAKFPEMIAPGWWGIHPLEKVYLHNETKVVSTGLIIEIPPGYRGRIIPNFNHLRYMYANTCEVGIGELKIILSSYRTRAVEIIRDIHVAHLLVEKIVDCKMIKCDDL